MLPRSKSRITDEQFNVGTALGILAQYLPDKKLAQIIGQQGFELTMKAQAKMQNEFDGNICPPTAAERFLAWLRKHEGNPPIPESWVHIYAISAKPLPPKEELKLSPTAMLHYLNELYKSTANAETKTIISSVANRITDEIEICGTPWRKGPVGGPH